MMKKYNRPEIEALALEVIDVIETSGGTSAKNMMESDSDLVIAQDTTIQVVNQNIASMDNQWQW